MINIFHELWVYRGFIFGAVKKEFVSKYKKSIFGLIWTVIPPALMIAIYVIVFSGVMQSRGVSSGGRDAYAVNLCIGIIFWTLFTDSANRAMSIFIDNVNIIKKINFPKSCLVIIVFLGAASNAAILYGLLRIVVVAYSGLHVAAFAGSLLLGLAAILFGMAVGFFVGFFNIFYRDAGLMFSSLLQVWFWLTPIVYGLSALPESIKPVIFANPMSQLVLAAQHLSGSAGMVSYIGLCSVAAVTLALTGLSVALYRHAFVEILDEI